MDNSFPLHPQTPWGVRAQEILISQPLGMMLVSEDAISEQGFFFLPLHCQEPVGASNGRAEVTVPRKYGL